MTDRTLHACSPRWQHRISHYWTTSKKTQDFMAMQGRCWEVPLPPGPGTAPAPTNLLAGTKKFNGSASAQPYGTLYSSVGLAVAEAEGEVRSGPVD